MPECTQQTTRCGRAVHFLAQNWVIHSFNVDAVYHYVCQYCHTGNMACITVHLALALTLSVLSSAGTDGVIDHAEVTTTGVMTVVMKDEIVIVGVIGIVIESATIVAGAVMVTDGTVNAAGIDIPTGMGSPATMRTKMLRNMTTTMVRTLMCSQ